MKAAVITLGNSVASLQILWRDSGLFNDFDGICLFRAVKCYFILKQRNEIEILLKQYQKLSSFQLQVKAARREQMLRPIGSSFKLASFKEEQLPYRSCAVIHVGAAVLAQVARSGRSELLLDERSLSLKIDN